MLRHVDVFIVVNLTYEIVKVVTDLVFEILKLGELGVNLIETRGCTAVRSSLSSWLASFAFTWVHKGLYFCLRFS